MLLEAGDPNEDRSLELHLALHVACVFRKVNMMYFLLEHGAQVEFPGEEAIIHNVLKTKNVEILSTLIARGADIEVKNSSEYTPLANAVYLNLPNQVLALLAAGNSLLNFYPPRCHYTC